MEEFLFVYGTLRKGAAHPMYSVLASHASPVGKGNISGKLFDLGHYPAAVTDHSGAWRVVGDVYRLFQPETVLKLLDQYEGCAPDSPQPWEYRRAREVVSLDDGGKVEAWVYLSTKPLPKTSQILSGDYLEGLA